jgi:hypothetical protein
MTACSTKASGAGREVRTPNNQTGGSEVRPREQARCLSVKRARREMRTPRPENGGHRCYDGVFD